MKNFSLKCLLENNELWFFIVFVLSLLAWNTNILAVVALPMWIPVIYRLVNRAYPSVKTFQQSDIKLVALLLVYAGVSLLWSQGGWLLLSKELVRVAICFSMLLLFVYAPSGNKLIELPIAMLLAGSLAGLVLLIEPISALVFTGEVEGVSGLQLLIAGKGVFYHHEPTAWLFAILLILGVSQITDDRALLKGISGFAILICVLVLMFAQSRASYLGVLVAFLFLVSSYKGNMRLWILGAGVGALLAHFVVGAPLSISVLDVLSAEQAFNRNDIWQQGVELISKAQFFGYGFGASSVLQHVEGLDTPPQHLHNGYLSVLYYGGITGVLIFASLILSSLANNFSKEYNRPWYAVLLLGLTIFIYDGNHVITYPSSELYLFMLPVLVMASNRLKVENNQ